MRQLVVAVSTAFVLGIGGCATNAAQRAGPRTVQPADPSTDHSPAAQARADNGLPGYTAADVHFMQGMIGHHAQAVVMAGMTPTHGAGADIRILAERINVGQRDEIAFMQRWLRDRHETAPDPFAGHDMSTAQIPAAGMSRQGLAMPGMSMPDRSMPGGLMPGMLTPEQMKQLDASHGAEFDRLFLTFMIQHHKGALTMVDQLFSSPGAGQDVYVFRFASDVSADQNTEIERMRSMLAARANHGNAGADAQGAADAERVRLIAGSVRDLAAAQLRIRRQLTRSLSPFPTASLNSLVISTRPRSVKAKDFG